MILFMNLCIVVMIMIEIYSLERLKKLKKQLLRFQIMIVIVTILSIGLITTFSLLMDYYFYRLYKIINIILSIAYFWFIFLVIDLVIKPLKSKIKLINKLQLSTPVKYIGVIQTASEKITIDCCEYHIIEIKVSESEQKKVYLEKSFSDLVVGLKIEFAMVNNIITSYGVSDDEE